VLGITIPVQRMSQWRKSFFVGGLVMALWCVAGTVFGATTNQVPPAPIKLDPTYLVGAWIWADWTADRQTCRLWRQVEIPRDAIVSKARLRMSADNSYRVFLDGREFGQGSELRSLTEYDLSLVLTPGVHVLAVEAFNEYLEAGMLAGLHIVFADGQVMVIPSDETWKVVPEGQRGWMKRTHPDSSWSAAKVIAPFLAKPWAAKPARILYSPPLQPVILKFWQAGWFQVTLLALVALSMVICLRLLGRLAVQSKAQELLQRERARIARDIHDELGAGLTQLVLFGEVAQTELLAAPEAHARFNGVSEQGRRLLRCIDEVVWMVNSQRDTLQDFETYVCRYAENFLHATAIRCRLEADAEIPETAFALAARRNLFLAFKEALTNAVKHSGATEVLVKLHVVDGEVRVTVEDNGKGFVAGTEDGGRNGLSNMAQRAAEIGGRCRVVSQPGVGCRVELAVPLAPRSAERAWWQWWRRRTTQGET
jgi:signal transduction histidine kinase